MHTCLSVKGLYININFDNILINLELGNADILQRPATYNKIRE